MPHRYITLRSSCGRGAITEDDGRKKPRSVTATDSDWRLIRTRAQNPAGRSRTSLVERGLAALHYEREDFDGGWRGVRQEFRPAWRAPARLEMWPVGYLGRRGYQVVRTRDGRRAA